MTKRTAFSPPLTTSRSDVLVGDSDAQFRETIYAFVQSVSRLLTCRDAFAQELDLTPSQFAVLFGIAHRQGGNGITIGDLAARISLAPTHVTTEVRRLETAGLLSKHPDPSDRRSVRVLLTRHGESEVERIAPLVRIVNDALFKDVSADDFATLRKVSRRIIANFESAMAEVRRRRLMAQDAPEEIAEA